MYVPIGVSKGTQSLKETPEVAWNRCKLHGSRDGTDLPYE